MEDSRNGIRYVIWGLENQYAPDLTTPFKVMGYTYTAYDRQIEEFMVQNRKLQNKLICSIPILQIFPNFLQSHILKKNKSNL